MTLSPEDKAKMEKANPYLPGDVIHGFVDRYEIWNLAYTAACKDNAELQKYWLNQKRLWEIVHNQLKARHRELSAAHKDNAETITTLREQLEAEKQWNGELSGKVLYYHMYIKTRDERDRLREGIESLQNLLVCGPIADPSEILETAFHMIEALTPQGADTPCPECGGSGLKYPAPIIEMREDVPKCQLCNGTGKAQPCEVCGTVGGGGGIPRRDADGVMHSYNNAGDVEYVACPQCGA